MASLAISLSIAEITQMPKIRGSKVRVVATKAVAVKAVFMAIVGVLGRPMVGPMLWVPMGSSGI